MEIKQKQETELKSLKSFAYRLHCLRLIGIQEMIKLQSITEPTDLKAEIFELIAKNEVKNSGKIFKLSRLFFKNERTRNSPLTDSDNKPMEINTVIKCVFEFLALQDLKTCRRVCKKWDAIAEPLVRKVSVVKGKFSTSMDNFTDFVARFEGRTNFTFSAFEFYTIMPISSLTLNAFFSNGMMKDIKELAFHSIRLVDENETKLNIYDISDWISGLPLLSSLVITTDTYWSPTQSPTLLVICLYQLERIEKLQLSNCYVKVENGTKISPVNITLYNVLFFKNEHDHKLESVLLNDFIDFRRVEEIELNIRSSDCHSVKIALNDYTINIEDIKLKMVNGVYWATSVERFGVEERYLSNSSVWKQSGVQIKRFEVCQSSVDLFDLPLKIEEIIFLHKEMIISCSEPIALYCLKYLHFGAFCPEDLPVLRHFSNCNNLVALLLDGVKGVGNIILNLDWIPASVKKLSLKNIRLLTGDPNFTLDLLVLQEYCLMDAERIVEKVITRKLALLWDVNYDSNDSIIQLLAKPFCPQRILMGPFEWNEDKFIDSALQYHVDEKAKYYYFEDGYGESITKGDFQTWTCDIRYTPLIGSPY